MASSERAKFGNISIKGTAKEHQMKRSVDGPDRTFVTLPYTFEPTATPPALRQYDKRTDWKLQPVAARYPRFSTDREIADENKLEWVTPGHPLFEALRRHAVEKSQEVMAEGACFYSLEADSPKRVDFYRARIVDGLGQIVHERLFAAEILK